MNYWFLFNLNDGSLYGGSYLGTATEWTNVPDGCGVIGPFAESEANDLVKRAFVEPLTARVINGVLAATDYAPPVVVQPPSLEDVVADLFQLLADKGVVY